MNRAFKDRLTDPQDVVYYSKVATTQILEKFNRLEQEESVEDKDRMFVTFRDRNIDTIVKI